ncbi:MAG TPA: hypothetical protein VG245_01445 [Candidatus Dormibacteraeota bacterium]|jgi:hypothetical protein|nr:hypothetical protein [Candidatus Dormibacteraeota bacterium]
MADGDGAPATSAAPGTAAAAPSLVPRAFALGWQMAELTQMQDDPAWRLHLGWLLDQTTSLAPADRADLMFAQVQAAVTALEASRTSVTLASAPNPAPGATSPGGSAMKGPVAAAGSHIQLLTELMAKDFRLGKAYSIGVSLGQTVLVSTKVLRQRGGLALTLPYPDDALKTLWERGRTDGIGGQLRDLKTEFPDYASDAVASTLTTWSGAIDGHLAASATLAPADSDQLATEVYNQGQIWRALLSDEMKATDMLKTGNYATALASLVNQYRQLAWKVLGPMGLLLLVLAALVIGVLFIVASTSSPAQGAITAAVAGLGVFGITGATITATLKKALAEAERNLWQAEIAEAVVVAINKAPTPGTTAVVKFRVKLATRLGGAHVRRL